MKQRIALVAAGFVALFGMSSCLQVDQAINLKKDGSGTITEEVMLGAQMVAMMEGGLGGLGGDPNENPMADLYDEAKYKERAGEYGEGVAFSKLEKIERNGGKGVKVTYTFEDINKVKFTPGSAMDDMGPDQGEADDKPEQPLTFQYAGGVLMVNLPDEPAEAGEGEGEGAPDVADPAADAMAAQMMQMFKDMKVAARLNVESGIAETDASHVDGNTVTFMELNFGEIIKNPDGMKALQKLDDPNRAQLEKALKGVEGVKIETKEKIRVKVK